VNGGVYGVDGWLGGAWNRPAYLSRDIMRYQNELIYMKTMVSILVIMKTILVVSR